MKELLPFVNFNLYLHLGLLLKRISSEYPFRSICEVCTARFLSSRAAGGVFINYFYMFKNSFQFMSSFRDQSINVQSLNVAEVLTN